MGLSAGMLFADPYCTQFKAVNCPRHSDIKDPALFLWIFCIRMRDNPIHTGNQKYDFIFQAFGFVNGGERY